ncbi:MAG: hypothetical protein J07HR59_00779 [Halorubrum sp. J07HR59]|nr:MAG: hypothetical protein J07HR59_00779 [Halorubrum sp. J07HR59]
MSPSAGGIKLNQPRGSRVRNPEHVSTGMISELLLVTAPITVRSRDRTSTSVRTASPEDSVTGPFFISDVVVAV